ncbi:MAG: prephenate dehydrogenase/arogenate dehydrogenase family protein, partial [Anaerolineae bacterium]|nr:prephenate dehydrogenase/arogenate dehydrogenase family protein [Anaerolineae bacterium]
TYCLCVAPAAPGQAAESASDLATAVGARPHFVDPVEHDGLVALLDQAPFALAAALLQAACSQASWRELVRLGGGRFERLLGIIGEEPGPGFDTAAANLANVGRWLDCLQEALQSLRQQLEGGDEKAREQLTAALVDARLEWERHGEEARQPLPKVGFTMRRLFGMREP